MSDSAAHLLSFIIRWGIVPARVGRYPLAGTIAWTCAGRLARHGTELVSEHTWLLFIGRLRKYYCGTQNFTDLHICNSGKISGRMLKKATQQGRR